MPLALSPVVTREAALQVGLNIQALFHLQGVIEKDWYITLTLLTG